MPKSKVEKLSDNEFLKLAQDSFSPLHMATKLNQICTRKILERLETVPVDKKQHLATWEAKYKLIPQEQLAKIVGEAKTWSGIFEDLGYTQTGGEKNDGLRNYLEIKNISYSHLVRGNYLKDKIDSVPQHAEETHNHKHNCCTQQSSECSQPSSTIRNRGKSLDELLNTAKRLNGPVLRQRLVKQGLLDNQCIKCGNDEDAVLILDHIDGNHSNYVLGNLRILCGNCHKKTPTFGNKNTAYLTENQKKDRELRLLINGKKEKSPLSGQLEDILVLNVQHDGRALRRRLILEKLLPNICSECGIDDDEVLTIDHINGDHYDNILKNLRILCVNCHMKTTTYCSRNVAYLTEEEKTERKLRSVGPPKKKCLDCTELIYLESTRCDGCEKLQRRVVERPSLEQLLLDLKDNSYISVGKKYNVSDSAIRKWLKAYKTVPPMKNLPRKIKCEEAIIVNNATTIPQLQIRPKLKMPTCFKIKG